MASVEKFGAGAVRNQLRHKSSIPAIRILIRNGLDRTMFCHLTEE